MKAFLYLALSLLFSLKLYAVEAPPTCKSFLEVGGFIEKSHGSDSKKPYVFLEGPGVDWYGSYSQDFGLGSKEFKFHYKVSLNSYGDPNLLNIYSRLEVNGLSSTGSSSGQYVNNALVVSTLSIYDPTDIFGLNRKEINIGKKCIGTSVKLHILCSDSLEALESHKAISDKMKNPEHYAGQLSKVCK